MISGLYMADLASDRRFLAYIWHMPFEKSHLGGGCFWRFSHEHLPYISEKPPYEPQNLPYVSEIGGIIKHFPALMSRRMNQTTKFAMLCMPSSPRTSLSTYVATIWSAFVLFQCSDGRCMLVVKPSLCGLDCQPAAESVHDPFIMVWKLGLTFLSRLL